MPLAAKRHGEKIKVNQVLSSEECLNIQQLVRQVPIADHVARYTLRLVRQTRIREGAKDKPQIIQDYLAWGAGPRASQFLVLADQFDSFLL